jgi:putative Mn2+ efflux pump MntP
MCTFAVVMSTISIIINIIFVLCLTSPVVTRAVGLVNADDKPVRKLWIPLIFGLSQGVMAVAGFYLGKLMRHLFVDEFVPYLVFAMMLVVAVKLFVDSMRVLKGKMLYTVRNDWDFILLSVLAAFDVLLMSLTGPFFVPELPLGNWFFLAVVVAGFLWAYITVRIPFNPGVMKKMSFIEFSTSVFMVVIAVLYLFTDLI